MFITMSLIKYFGGIADFQSSAEKFNVISSSISLLNHTNALMNVCRERDSLAPPDKLMQNAWCIDP